MRQIAAIILLGLWSWTAQAQSCTRSSLNVPLLAQGTIPAGAVTVANDSTNVIVTYTATGSWTLRQLDVAVATTPAGLPQGAGGLPELSQFAHRQSFHPEVAAYTFTIPLSSLGGAEGASIYVAAHAAVHSPSVDQAHAWGSGKLFAGTAAESASGAGAAAAVEDSGDCTDGCGGANYFVYRIRCVTKTAAD